MSNFYELLGVSKTATPDEIKSAYRKKAMEHHPDRNGNSKESEELFKQVKQAYETLSNPSSRSYYDNYGKQSTDNFSQNQQHNPFHESSFQDIFADFFRQTHSSQSRQQSGRKPGEDVQFNLNLSLNACLEGMSVNAEVPTQIDCKVCEGTGSKDKKPLSSCPHCQGSGMFIRQQGNSIFQQTCPHCQGTGKHNPNPCSACSGQGFTTFNEVYTINISAVKG